jgi:hypothetical protein
MRAEDFALDMTTWLDIETVLEVAHAYQDGSASRDGLARLALHQPELSSGTEGDLVGLVSQYLRHFRMPLMWLQAIRGITDTGLNEDTYRWLQGLRFEGTVQCDVSVDDSPFDIAHLLIADREAVMKLLEQPLGMIVTTVTQCCTSWRKLLSELPVEMVWVRSMEDGPLAAYFDTWTARALGIPNAGVAGRTRDNAILLGFRYMALSASVEGLQVPALLQRTQEAHRNMAQALQSMVLKATDAVKAARA